MLEILEKTAWTVDEMWHRLRTSFGGTVDSLCDLETSYLDSHHALATHRGDMVTLIDLEGTTHFQGKEETHRSIEQQRSRLSGFLDKRAHSLQFVFEYDPDPVTGDNVLDSHMDRLYRGARRNGLHNVDDVLEDMREALGAQCSGERCTLVVKTKITIMDEQARKNEREENADYLVDNVPRTYSRLNAQNARAGYEGVADAHEGFVQEIEVMLKATGIIGRILDSPEACYRIRRQVDPEFTPETWRPSLPGDPIPETHDGRPSHSSDNDYWPPLWHQLIPRDPEAPSLRTVKIGDREYMPLQVDRLPKESLPFARLFSSLRASRTPYRISFRLTGGGHQALKARRQVADTLQYFSSQNKIIRQSFKAIEKTAREEEQVYVAMEIDAVTWRDAEQTDVSLRRRGMQLSSALQSWGGLETAQFVSSVADAVTASVAGLRMSTPSNTGVRKLESALMMMPFTRPTLPFDKGSLLLRSSDGKIMPFQQFSRHQDSSVILISGPMGRGKSVLLNALNFSLCIDETNSELPFIRLVDIGYSSRGLIAMLRSNLPSDQRHLALYHRMTTEKEEAINPMDTLLQCRRPVSAHRQWLIQFITLMCRPFEGEMMNGIAGVAQNAIDMAYDKFASDEYAKRYHENIEPVVDRGIERHGIEIDEHTTWFELCDAFMERNEIICATRCHARAMPVLSEVASQARDSKITGIYSEEETNYFWRSITETINELPMLNAPTAVDLQAARIISLDLGGVTPKGNTGPAARQTALMFSLGMWVIGNDILINEEMIREIPEYARPYHENYFKKVRDAKKSIGADEFHRTEGQPDVRNMFVTITREGRKAGVQTLLASQRGETDFDDTLINLSTTRLIIGVGTGSADILASKFKLSNTMVHIMENNLNGPGPGGSNVLVNVETKKSTYTQLATNTLGARSLWAFSTSPNDTRLRDRLMQRIGDEEARSILAIYYPKGSVDDEVERRDRAIDDSSLYGETMERDHDAVRDIEEEMVEAFEERRKSRVLEQS